MFTDGHGMTLYVYDLDHPGMSNSNHEGSEKWTPHVYEGDDALTEGWTLVKRTNGTMQLAYFGKPTYLFAGDKNKGDMHGDGLDGVWHILKG